MEILAYDQLRNANNSLEFEGADQGGAGVSLFVVDAAAERHVSRSRGRDRGAGHIVVVPAGEPHGFTAGSEGSKQVNIHASPRFVTEWLEEEAYG